MRQSDSTQRARSWVVDYSAARAKAIEWLGDRYLLAKPINRVAGHAVSKAGNDAWPRSPAPSAIA